MDIGIIQGRLSLPLEGFQECPADWKKEFSNLSKLGLSHIEWIITKKSFFDNPFFKNDLSEYPIHSVCADNLVDERIDDFEFVNYNLNPICLAAVKNNVKFVTIPLLEDSSVEDDIKRDKFNKILKTFVNRYPDLNFSIEAELEIEKLSEILQISDTVCVTYDTGNITSFGIDHEEYIERLLPRISNIHLKDRTLQGKTVPPSTGDTNFKLIFDKLRKFNYSNVFTLQTARETEGKEIETISKHLDVLRSINE